MDISARPVSESSASPAWEAVRQALKEGMDPEFLEVRQFVLDSPFIPGWSMLWDYARDSFPAGRCSMPPAT